MLVRCNYRTISQRPFLLNASFSVELKALVRLPAVSLVALCLFLYGL